MLSIMWVTIFLPILCKLFVLFAYFIYFPGSFFRRSPSQGRLDRRKIKLGTSRKAHRLDKGDLINI
jgi:hypothetical protein